MRTKKIIISLLALVFAVSMLFACVSNDLKLSGFEVEAEVTANYGESYSVKNLVVKDNAENVYEVSVEVKCGNENVALTSGKFMITSMTDYIITYTVTITSSDVRTATTIVKVVNSVKPVVTFGQFDTLYVVGDEIVLPEITATDDVDGAITPVVTVVRLGEPETEITVANNKFTAEVSGEYEIRAKATDSSSNSGEKTVSFAVRSGAIDKEFESFDTKYSMYNASAGSYSNTVVSGYTTDKIGGRTAYGDGFAYFKSSDESGTVQAYPGLKLTPRMTKEQMQTAALDGYDKVVIRMYLDYENARNVYRIWNGAGTQSKITELQPRMWTDVAISVEDVISNYDAIISDGVQLFYLPNHESETADGIRAEFTVYIDTIFLAKAQTFNVTGAFLNEEYVVGDEMDFSDLAIDVADAEYEYAVMGPFGKVMSIENNKFTIAEFGAYKVMVTLNELTIYGSKTVNVSVKASVSDVESVITAIVNAEDKESAEVSANVERLAAGYAVLTDEEKNNLSLKPDYVYALINKNFDYLSRSANTATYIEKFDGEISAKNISAVSGTTPLVSGYTTEAIGGVTSSDGGFAYISSARIDNGALKEYPALNVTPRITKAEAQAYLVGGATRISMKCYLDAQVTKKILEKWSGSNAAVEFVQPKTWTTVYFSLSKFIAAYDKLASGAVSFFFMGNDLATKEVYNFYIDGIKIVTEETHAVDDNVVEGFVDETSTARLYSYSSTYLQVGYETNAISGETATYGSGFWYLSSMRKDNGAAKEYPAMLTSGFSMSKADLQTYFTNGSTVMEMRYYLDSDNAVNIYEKWSGTQNNLGALQTRKWTTVSFSLEKFIAAYDDIIANSKREVFFLGNGNLYNLKLYVDYFAVVIPDTSEYELTDFNSSATAALFETWHSNTQTVSGFSTETVGGENNGYFYYTPTAVGTGYNKEYIALWAKTGAITMTKAKAQELLDKGYSKIALRYYFQATAREGFESADLALHMSQIGTQTVDLGALTVGSWSTIYIDMTEFVAKYDSITTYGTKFLQIANVGCKVDFKIYFDSMTAVIPD